MNFKRIRFWLLWGFLAIFLIITGIVVAGFWAADPYQWRRVSSSELAARFHNQHSGFERVAAMLIEDEDRVGGGDFQSNPE